MVWNCIHSISPIATCRLSRVDNWRADGLSNRQDPHPFPVAARQTGRAVFLHPAFSKIIMPSPTEGFAVSFSAG